MLIKELISNTQTNNLRSSIKNEDGGVGIITKQNTTKDVNKHTLRKMLKAFKLI